MVLDGPRLPAASGGPARALVVFIHGYGADGNDLIAIGREWSRVLPDAAFVAPNAPEPCAGAPSGFQWFPLARIDPDELSRGVRGAAPLLEQFIDRELEQLGLAAERLALVGFSQGTMMALHVGLRRSSSPAAIVGYSGALAAPETLNDEISVRPPVLLVHGDADQVIPVEALLLAAGALGRAEVSTQWHISRGTGHGIDAQAITLGGRFLADALMAPMMAPGQ